VTAPKTDTPETAGPTRRRRGSPLAVVGCLVAFCVFVVVVDLLGQPAARAVDDLSGGDEAVLVVVLTVLGMLATAMSLPAVLACRRWGWRALPAALPAVALGLVMGAFLPARGRGGAHNPLSDVVDSDVVAVLTTFGFAWLVLQVVALGLFAYATRAGRTRRLPTGLGLAAVTAAWVVVGVVTLAAVR
jgi:hypothetical protein